LRRKLDAASSQPNGHETSMLPLPRVKKLDRNLTTGNLQRKPNSSDAPFEDRREVMVDCGMGARVHELKKHRGPEPPGRKKKKRKRRETLGTRSATQHRPHCNLMAALNPRGECGE
jgi:hypothetical protein